MQRFQCGGNRLSGFETFPCRNFGGLEAGRERIDGGAIVRKR